MTSAQTLLAAYPALSDSAASVEGDFTAFKDFFSTHGDAANSLFSALETVLKTGVEIVETLRQDQSASTSRGIDLEIRNAALRDQLDQATKLKPPKPQPAPTPHPPVMSTPGATTPESSEIPDTPQRAAYEPVVPRTRAPDVPIFPTQSANFGRERQSEYENWRSSLRAKMVLDGASFPRAIDRILYTTQRLTGDAYARVRPIVDEITTYPDSPAMWPRNVRDFGDILRILNPVYITIDTFAQSQRDYENLYQGKTPYAEFIAEFTRLAGECDLSARQLVAGLNQKVSATLSNALISVVVRPGSDDFDGWEQLYRTISNNILDSKHRARVAGGGVPQGSQRTGDGDPMDLDAITAGGKRGPLSDAERDRRRKGNLCMYCGGSGHYASACPARPRGPEKA